MINCIKTKTNRIFKSSYVASGHVFRRSYCDVSSGQFCIYPLFPYIYKRATAAFIQAVNRCYPTLKRTTAERATAAYIILSGQPLRKR